MGDNLFNNPFPYTNNMDTEKTQSDFDYSLWNNIESEIFIKRIPNHINSSYKHHTYYTDYNDMITYYTSNFVKKITTKFILQSDTALKVDIPFDYIRTCNYITVKKPIPPIPNTIDKRFEYYFYFINKVEYKAPNCTILHLELDVINTYLYKVDIQNMYLETGHYPVSKVNVDTYLQNPISYTKWLMGDEEVRNTTRMEKLEKKVVSYNKFYGLNTSNQYVCFALSVPPRGNWNGQVPEPDYSIIYRIPTNVYVIGCPVAYYQTFMDNMREENPQMLPTIKMMFVVDKKFISLDLPFTLNGVQVNYILGIDGTMSNITLNKSMFNFPAEYEHLAKLYTSDFCSFTAHDNKGNIRHFNIEDTTSNLGVNFRTLIDHPFLEIQTYIKGLGGDTETAYSVKKFNVTEDINITNDMWGEYKFSHEIPTFVIYENAYDNYEFSNRRLNEHNHLENTNVLDNATDHNNAVADNQIDLANNQYDNTGIKQKATDDLTENGIARMHDLTQMRLEHNLDMVVTQASVLSGQVETKIDYATGNANMNALSTISDTLIQDEIGIKSFVGGMVDVGINYGRLGNFDSFTEAGLTLAHTDIYWQYLLNAQVMADINGLNNTIVVPDIPDLGLYGTIDPKVGLTPEYNRSDFTINNLAVSEVAGNTKDTLIGNANRLKNTENAIANNQYDTAEDQIQANLDQSKLAKPLEDGYYSGDGFDQGTGIMGLSVQIRKVPNGIIQEFGDRFLKYGYVLNQYIDFTNIHVMPVFSYWKATEVTFNGDITNEASKKLEDIFQSGITFWKDPNDIGVKTIYDNK